MQQIHPTAIVAPGATFAEDVAIGPYCVVGEEVVLGAGVKLMAHVVVDGHTTIGERTRIFPFASIGLEPQDLKYAGEKSSLVIGRNNTIREHVTMNPGTEGGGMITRVGDDGLFMVGAHVAHDCQIGDHVIMANNATLAGHVVVEDFVLLGGLVVWLGLTNQIFFDRHTPAWMILAVALIAWGAYAFARPGRGWLRGERWTRGVSLVLLGVVMLVITRVPFLMIGKLFAVAGIILALRGLVVDRKQEIKGEDRHAEPEKVKNFELLPGAPPIGRYGPGEREKK